MVLGSQVGIVQAPFLAVCPFFFFLGGGSTRPSTLSLDIHETLDTLPRLPRTTPLTLTKFRCCIPRDICPIEQWSQSSGSNVIPRRARPGLAGLRPHILQPTGQLASTYRGTSLMKNTPPPRITLGPNASGYCRVLRGGGFL